MSSVLIIVSTKGHSEDCGLDHV